MRDEEVTDSAIWALALSTDEKFIFLGGVNPVIQKYSFETLKPLQRFEGHTDEVNAILVSYDGLYMYSCSDDGTVRVWSLSEDSQYEKVIYTHSGIVYALDLSENNIYAASGSQDCSTIIYELAWEQGVETGRVLENIQGEKPIWAIKISPNSRFLVTGDSDGVILILGFMTWDKLKKFKEGNRIRSISIAKDERYIVTAGQDQKIVIWLLDKNKDPIVMEGHTDMVKSALITHDQEFIVSLADDTMVIRWKIPFFEDKTLVKLKSDVKFMWGVGPHTVCLTPEEIFQLNNIGITIQSLKIEDYEFSYKTADDFLYTFKKTSDFGGKLTYVIKEFNLSEIVFTKEYSVSCGEIKSICISNDRKYLSIGGVAKILTFLVMENMKLYNSQIYHEGDINSMVLTPDNAFLFSAGEQGEIKMIDTDKMQDNSIRNVLYEIKEFEEKDSIQFLCTPDSSKIMIYSPAKLLIWSISQRSQLKKIIFSEVVEKITISSIYNFFFMKQGDFIEVGACPTSTLL